MSAHVRMMKIGKVCRLVNGRAFKPSDWTHEGLPIVRIQNLNDESKPFNYYNGPVKQQFLVDNGHVLLSWSGTPGTSFGCFIWVRGRAILNQHIFRVHVDQALMLDEYFAHAVNARLDEMIALSHGGVGLRHITKGKLESIELPAPPIREQMRIVERCRAAFGLLDETQHLWMGALAEARALETSLLRESQEALVHAPRARIGDIVEDMSNGRSISEDEAKGTGTTLTLSAVRSIDTDLSQCKPIVLDAAIGTRYAVRAGDVYVSRSNTVDLVGLSSMVRDTPPERLIYPDLLIRLTPTRDRVDSAYLTIALRFPETRDRIRLLAKGSSQSMVKISGQSLRSVEIPLPELRVQHKVVERAEALLACTRALTQEMRSRDTGWLRTAILRRILPAGN